MEHPRFRRLSALVQSSLYVLYAADVIPSSETFIGRYCVRRSSIFRQRRHKQHGTLRSVYSLSQPTNLRYAEKWIASSGHGG